MFQVIELLKARSKTMEFTAVVIQLHPRCTGRVLLQSKDPFDYPTMDPNYLCSEYDIKSLIAGTVSLLYQRPHASQHCTFHKYGLHY